MLGPLDGHLETMLACTALQTKYQLLGSLGLLTQNRLGLTTKTLLFSVVTLFALGKDGLLGLLVLGHLELLMLVVVRTVGPAGFWDVDHFVTMFNGKKLELKNSINVKVFILFLCHQLSNSTLTISRYTDWMH